MIGKGKSISHGVAALEYNLAQRDKRAGGEPGITGMNFIGMLVKWCRK
ncbi:hypothetical protein ACRFA2_22545 (plasmid) [Bacteroides hominis]